MNTLEIILLSLTSLFALAFIVIRTIKGGLAGLILKVLASFAFVSSAVIGLVITDSMHKLSIGLIIVGLLLGMIGDILLDLKVIYDNDKFYLNFGMLSFGLGHICYFSAVTLYALNFINAILLPIFIAVAGGCILTIAIMFGSKIMKLEFGNFLWQTVGYTFLLTLMVVYALVVCIMGGNWILFVGMLVFFLSDVVLSKQYFGGLIASKPLIAINHALYYAAQILLVAFIFVL